VTTPSGPGWIERVRAAAAGPELLGFLARRLSTPYEEGPRLDDRRGEGVEDVFVAEAKLDDVFRDRLDETIAGYLRSPASSPAGADARPVIRGLLEIVGVLSLAGCASPVRAWLSLHDAALRADPDAILGRAALGALATLPGSADARDFWLRTWRNAPVAWQPRAFIGLRLHDPRAAAGEIPELLRRAEAQAPGARPLLLGMWKQEVGRAAIIEWLNTAAREDADKVRRALRDLVPPEDRAILGEPRVRRTLRFLTIAGNVRRAWDLAS
jgi:hypothetical protein